MARAIAARSKGDDFQARWFWLQVCRLFEERTKVTQVEYEADGAKAFDDVVVRFNDQYFYSGQPVAAEFYQLKFHVTGAKAITWQFLIDPSAIGANSVSLLERLRDAQVHHAPKGYEAQFILLTNWTIDHNDSLAKIVSKTDGQIEWHRLVNGGSRSEMGKIRSAFKTCLNINTDDELRLILSPFRIQYIPGTLQQLERELNLHLRIAGLRPVPDGCLSNPYDELTRKLLQSELTSFDRSGIEQICKQEGLWVGHTATEPEAHCVGIRSFLRWAENLADLTDDMLDLVSYFDGRKIRSPELWTQQIFPQVQAFLEQSLQPGQRCHLHLHTHTSIAFASGYCISPKSGINVAIAQSSLSGRELWLPDSRVDRQEYSQLTFNEEIIASENSDVAVALGISHDVLEDVKVYLSQAQLPVQRIVQCLPESCSGQNAIRDGNHARLLAEQLATHLKQLRTASNQMGRLHIFAACPNALMFFLGQVSQRFGQCTLYEFDFDAGIPGAYQPSLSFPPVTQ
jgi:SMODS-associated and fused to various effectors sensor domain